MDSPARTTPDSRLIDITDAELRRWLSLIHQPDRLVDPKLERLLTAADRLPASGSPLEVGRAVAQLFTEKIERLKPSEGATRHQELPHLVLQICFVEGAKLFQAAARLGMSERQLSRERSRAVSLLRAELLSATTPKRYRAEPVPAIHGFLPRLAQTQALEEALEEHRLVAVSGPPGVGKSTLVAETITRARARASVMWYRFRPGVNDTLTALLFELGDYLADADEPDLAHYLEGSLQSLDTGLATRLVLRGLAAGPHLLVFDDFHVTEGEPAIGNLFEEMVERLRDLRVVTIGRHKSPPRGGVALEVPNMSRTETADLLTRLKINCSPQMARTLHTWTQGNAHLVRLAASWMKTASKEEISQGVFRLKDREEVQRFLLDYITELLDSQDRALLEAASVFRDRFSDDALAFVSGQTRGAVLDASLRLVRVYVATRSLEGDSAFFHTSVRDYIYERLSPERRAELHAQAAEWYRRNDDPDAAEYHSQAAAARSRNGQPGPTKARGS